MKLFLKKINSGGISGGGGDFVTIIDMLVNYFAINLFSFGRFRDDPIFTIDCIRYVNI